MSRIAALDLAHPALVDRVLDLDARLELAKIPLLVAPVARSIPEHLAAGKWREAGIAGAIVAVVAAPLGLKYAGRLVTAVKGLRGSK